MGLAMAWWYVFELVAANILLVVTLSPHNSQKDRDTVRLAGLDSNCQILHYI